MNQVIPHHCHLNRMPSLKYLLNWIQVGGTAGKFQKFLSLRSLLKRINRCDGKRGWFPSNYVEVISDDIAEHQSEQDVK